MIFNTISILVDNDSWILKTAKQLVKEFIQQGIKCQLIREQKHIPIGDVCFLLGCTKILPKQLLKRNTHNLVVHESALPSGKGFAPMSWQILTNQNTIPVCLIDASDNVDSGNIWLEDTIKLTGYELHDEWRQKQGLMTIKLAKRFVSEYKVLTSIEQTGKQSFFNKRMPEDSQLDISKSIKEQFNLLRVCSNSNYPAFFILNGIKYSLSITKSKI